MSRRAGLSIALVTPAAPGSVQGNRVTAERWARRLAELGHRVRLTEQWDGAPCDLLVALHARKSAAEVRRYRQRCPAGPLVVALTGTDLYQDLPAGDPEAAATVARADRLAALQPLAAAALPAAQRGKLRVLWQSATAVPPLPPPEDGSFRVCVLAHLRAVKDPLAAARAARRLPATSRLGVWHAGGVLEPALGEQARHEAATNPRYRWLGELPHQAARALLAGSRLLVVSSRLEGGANVVSEALAAGVPVLASRIAGSLGMLGEAYPGLFPPGDDEALARLLLRAETDPAWLAELRAWGAALAHQVSPEAERTAWRSLLAELFPDRG